MVPTKSAPSPLLLVTKRKPVSGLAHMFGLTPSEVQYLLSPLFIKYLVVIPKEYPVPLMVADPGA